MLKCFFYFNFKKIQIAVHLGFPKKAHEKIWHPCLLHIDE